MEAAVKPFLRQAETLICKLVPLLPKPCVCVCVLLSVCLCVTVYSIEIAKWTDASTHIPVISASLGSESTKAPATLVELSIALTLQISAREKRGD